MPSLAQTALTEPRSYEDPDLRQAWESIILPPGLKQRLLNHALLALTLRRRPAAAALSIHGLLVFYGPPGTGKTTLGRGLAYQVGTILKGKHGPVRLIELNPHALASEMLGRTQRGVVQIFEDHVPAYAEEGPVILLLDEVEALAAARSRTSLEANPVDVHRATDAVLSGLDRLAKTTPNVVAVATTNFQAGLDDAFLSRADFAVRFPLPDEGAIHEILKDTLSKLTLDGQAEEKIVADKRYGEVVRLLVGLDGRQIRKFVIETLARDVELTLNPDRLRIDHLLSAATERNAAQKAGTRLGGNDAS
jgi:AAA+ superfamily predicted ATPase